MLFITMCRCAGIPARGNPDGRRSAFRWNMHDWCEFHLEPWGWLPPTRRTAYSSTTTRASRVLHRDMDAYRLIVNTDYGRPLWPAKKSLRSEPLDFQRGEVEVTEEPLLRSVGLGF